jgi:hypothetical protein
MRRVIGENNNRTIQHSINNVAAVAYKRERCSAVRYSLVEFVSAWYSRSRRTVDSWSSHAAQISAVLPLLRKRGHGKINRCKFQESLTKLPQQPEITRARYTSAALTSASYSRSRRTVDWCPFHIATMSAVLPHSLDAIFLVCSDKPKELRKRR